MSPSAQRTWLLDGNVLVALADASHVHHGLAESWFAAARTPFATCPITQGTLLRVLLGTGAATDVGTAIAALRSLVEHPRHRFWADECDYLQVDLKGVIGHRQVTDAYLASLARRQGGRLATFDQGLRALHPDVVELIA
ncbi:MAG: PIN domain-containing protein [Pseudoxanthomonas sp.]